MKIYLQNHFDWCKIIKYTLSQIFIGLLFANISFAEKSSAQTVRNCAVSISVDDTHLNSALREQVKDENVKFGYNINVIRIDGKNLITEKKAQLVVTGKVTDREGQPLI